MVFEPGLERGLFLELAPRAWIIMGLVALGAAVFVALIVLALVSSSNFNDSHSNPPITHGNCYPFACTYGPDDQTAAPAVG